MTVAVLFVAFSEASREVEHNRTATVMERIDL